MVKSTRSCENHLEIGLILKQSDIKRNSNNSNNNKIHTSGSMTHLAYGILCVFDTDEKKKMQRFIYFDRYTKTGKKPVVGIHYIYTIQRIKIRIIRFMDDNFVCVLFLFLWPKKTKSKMWCRSYCCVAIDKCTFIVSLILKSAQIYWYASSIWCIMYIVCFFVTKIRLPFIAIPSQNNLINHYMIYTMNRKFYWCNITKNRNILKSYSNLFNQSYIYFHIHLLFFMKSKRKKNDKRSSYQRDFHHHITFNKTPIQALEFFSLFVPNLCVYIVLKKQYFILFIKL